jgi:hypothetical protein
MARRSRRARRTAPLPEPEIAMEAGPSRPPWASLVFVCLAIAYLTWYVLTSGALGQPNLGDAVTHVLRVTPGIAAILLPAALLLRHPDAWRRIRILVVGAVVFASVQALIVLADPLQPVFETLTPSGTEPGAIVPLAAAYEILVGVVTGLGLGCLAIGLSRARQRPDPDSRATLIVPIAAVLATVAGILSTARLDFTGVSITPTLTAYLAASLAIGVVRVVAWAFLAAVALRGWRVGESPATGWWLALLGAALVLFALTLLNVRGLIDVTDQTVDVIYGYIEATAYAAGTITLLVAFAVGLPAIPGADDEEPAEDLAA